MILSPLQTDDAYGPAAAGLLALLGPGIADESTRIVDAFYEHLISSGEAGAILERLSDDERRHLRHKQAQHLGLLARPDLDPGEHRRHAERVGHIHAMLGVDVCWLVEAYGLYQRALNTFIDAGGTTPQALASALRVLSRRLQVDLETQVAGYRRYDAELASGFADLLRAVQASSNLGELYQSVLGALRGLGGVAGALAGRRGNDGVLAVEASEGAAMVEYLGAIESGVLPEIRLDGQVTPSERAWNTGEIQVVDSIHADPRMAPWARTATRAGLRSLIVIPLLDDLGETFGLIAAYGTLPGLFSGPTRRAWWQQLQQGVTLAAQKHARGAVVPLATRRHYSALVRNGGVHMLYQPLIDLASGALASAEALARLREDDGTLVSPARFLPALAGDDFLHLFDHGLRAACDTLRSWRLAGLDCTLAVNLPPQATGDRRYHGLLFSCLEVSAVDTERLQLEVLETPDAGDSPLRSEFFATIRSLGIGIVQDDLGAGHSSLLRLSSMPFDAIKIDQGLVQQLLGGDPARALEFVYHLTRLAHGVGVKVTAEGLEHAGLIEAVTILGVDKGQGYAIARPMTADDLTAWARARRPEPCSMANPRTALGALAAQLLWDEQLYALQRWPGLIDAFVESPCPVREYVQAHAATDGEIVALLQTNRRHARAGQDRDTYERTRRELRTGLTRLWHDELGRAEMATC